MKEKERIRRKGQFCAASSTCLPCAWARLRPLLSRSPTSPRQGRTPHMATTRLPSAYSEATPHPLRVVLVFPACASPWAGAAHHRAAPPSSRSVPERPGSRASGPPGRLRAQRGTWGQGLSSGLPSGPYRASQRPGAPVPSAAPRCCRVRPGPGSTMKGLCLPWCQPCRPRPGLRAAPGPSWARPWPGPLPLFCPVTRRSLLFCD